MRFNTTALVLAPGIGLAGSLAGGWQGLGWALGAWCVFVALGTAVLLVHGLIDKAKANTDSPGMFANNRPSPTASAPEFNKRSSQLK